MKKTLLYYPVCLLFVSNVFICLLMMSMILACGAQRRMLRTFFCVCMYFGFLVFAAVSCNLANGEYMSGAVGDVQRMFLSFMVLEVALIWVRCFFCLHSCWCFLFKRWYLKGGYEWWSGGCWAELWIKENHLNQISRGPRFNIWNILMSSNTKHNMYCISNIWPITPQSKLYILIYSYK